MRWFTVMGLFVLPACGSDISGTVGSASLDRVRTALHSDEGVLFFANQDVPCRDLSWVSGTYGSERPEGLGSASFVAVQVVLGGGAIAEGTFPLTGGQAYGLIVGSDSFETFAGFAGTLEIESAGGRNDPVIGHLDLQFAAGEVEGGFRTERCVNLSP